MRGRAAALDDFADVRALVGRAFQVRDDLQRRCNQPQIAGNGAFPLDQRQAGLLDMPFKAVDHHIAFLDAVRLLHIVFLQRLAGLTDHAVYHRRHIHQVRR